jgi:hypothetical protein
MIRSLCDDYNLDLNDIPPVDIFLLHLFLVIFIYNLIV